MQQVHDIHHEVHSIFEAEIAKLSASRRFRQLEGKWTASLMARTGWPCGLRGSCKGYWLFATADGYIISIQ